MKAAHDGDHLSCGAELGTLVDQVAENLSPADPQHQACCEHCQRTLAELEPLWGQVRELAREEVVPPSALVATVMQAVRAERTGGANRLPLRAVVPQLVEHALLLGERGSLRIADSVIAQVIAREALATPGVIALDTGATPAMFGRSTRGVDVSVEESRVWAQLLLVVAIGFSIPDVVRSVRELVTGAVRDITGLDAVAIDITVTDVRGD